MSYPKSAQTASLSLQLDLIAVNVLLVIFFNLPKTYNAKKTHTHLNSIYLRRHHKVRIKQTHVCLFSLWQHDSVSRFIFVCDPWTLGHEVSFWLAQTEKPRGLIVVGRRHGSQFKWFHVELLPKQKKIILPKR